MVKTDHLSNYLVCVNAEKYSVKALEYAANLAKKMSSGIILLHVIEPSDYQTLGAIADKILKEKHEECQNLLHQLAAEALEASGIMPMLVVKEGFIEEEIIKVIKEDATITMFITGVSKDHNKKSRIIPPLTAALGNKLHVPMLIVPL